MNEANVDLHITYSVVTVSAEVLDSGGQIVQAMLSLVCCMYSAIYQ